MKNITALYIILCIMQCIILLNVTVFDGEFAGIMMALSTILFIIGSIFYSSSRQRKNIN
jgi:predicted membrane channel-forming protein YqfA (hemolysin III family)